MIISDVTSPSHTKGELNRSIVAVLGRYSDVDVLRRPTPGTIGQGGNELRKSFHCGLNIKQLLLVLSQCRNVFNVPYYIAYKRRYFVGLSIGWSILY